MYIWELELLLTSRRNDYFITYGKVEGFRQAKSLFPIFSEEYNKIDTLYELEFEKSQTLFNEIREIEKKIEQIKNEKY